MKLIKVLLIFLAIAILLSSCDSFSEPTLEGIENVELKTISTNRLLVEADMLIHNPNPFALDLEAADLRAIVEEIELASIAQTYETEMPANDNFRMPVEIDLDLTKLYKDDPLGAISKGLKIANERKLSVLFQGEIKVGKGGAKIPVPIDQIEEVKF